MKRFVNLMSVITAHSFTPVSCMDQLILTYFISALWPFSTLGWPDLSSEDFKTFYPTTMLETGYVITWIVSVYTVGLGCH